MKGKVTRKTLKSAYLFLGEMLYEALFFMEGEKLFLKSILDLPEISRYIENWASSGDFGIIALDYEVLMKIKRESEFSHDTRTLVNYYNGVVRILKVERVWAQKYAYTMN